MVHCCSYYKYVLGSRCIYIHCKYNHLLVDVIHINAPCGSGDDDLYTCYEESLSVMIPKKLRSIVSIY